MLKLLRYFAVRTKHIILHTLIAGDYVIVINAKKLFLQATNWKKKIYDTYTGYPGGRKEETAKNLMKRRPEVVIERAVKGMLPKNRLGRKMYKKLFVYAGDRTSA